MIGEEIGGKLSFYHFKNHKTGVAPVMFRLASMLQNLSIRLSFGSMSSMQIDGCWEGKRKRCNRAMFYTIAAF